MREAREYGVKTFPSILMFVNKVPELFEGDLKDSSDVLGWILTQAGLVDPPEEETDFSILPAVAAAQGPPPTKKVAPSPKKEKAAPAPPKAASSAADETP